MATINNAETMFTSAGFKAEVNGETVRVSVHNRTIAVDEVQTFIEELKSDNDVEIAHAIHSVEKHQFVGYVVVSFYHVCKVCQDITADCDHHDHPLNQ